MSKFEGMPRNIFYGTQYLGDFFKDGKNKHPLKSGETEPVHIAPGQTRRINIGFRMELHTGEQIVVYPSEALELSGLEIVREDTYSDAFGTSLLIRNTLEKSQEMGVQGFQPIKLGDKNNNGPGIRGVYEINCGDLLGYAVLEKKKPNTSRRNNIN